MSIIAIKVDYRSCTGCQKCYDLCPMDVYTWNEEKNIPCVTYWEECYFCGVCWMECPKRAIDIIYPPSKW